MEADLLRLVSFLPLAVVIGLLFVIKSKKLLFIYNWLKILKTLIKSNRRKRFERICESLQKILSVWWIMKTKYRQK